MPINNVKFGGNVQVWHPDLVNLYGCDIGDDTTIGAMVEIHHSFLCEGVTLGDRVFIGHGVMFCNEKYPQASRPEPWELKREGRVYVGDGAIIGSNATILPGVRIEPRATVGAGSVVVGDVPAGMTVVGNPAMPTKEYLGRALDAFSPHQLIQAVLEEQMAEGRVAEVGPTKHQCCGADLEEKIEERIQACEERQLERLKRIVR